MLFSRGLLAVIISLTIFTPGLSQAGSALCSALFSSATTPSYTEIIGAHRYQTSTADIKGAITFNTNSIVANISAIKFKSPTTEYQLTAALHPAGAMGFAGPLGPLGPLSQWGPVGNKLTHPTYVISTFDWSLHAKYLNSKGGPLDKNGVFGQHSAVSKYGDNLNNLLPDAKVLEEGSPLMVLGTKGLLGAYSLIGALGPNGAHGHKRDNLSGHFVDEQGKIVTEVSVETENGKASEKLVELYTDNQAEQLSEQKKLQDRFAIDIGLPKGKIKDYHYSAKAGEWIMFGVIPTGFGDHFSIEIVDAQGNTLSKSDSNKLINMSVFKFAHDAQVIIRVKNEGPSPYYNAYVESINAYYKAFASLNPFAQKLTDLIPPNVLTQTSQCRVIVGTSPVKDNTEITQGPHWSQFY